MVDRRLVVNSQKALHTWSELVKMFGVLLRISLALVVAEWVTGYTRAESRNQHRIKRSLP